MKRFAAVMCCLLAISGVLAVGASAKDAAKPSVNYKAMEKLGWKLSCQAWTFRELTAFETIDTLHDLGIRYIEFFPGQRFSKEHPDAKVDHTMAPERIEELQKKLKEANVTAVNYGVVGIPNDEPGARKVFDWAKKMGLKTIVSEPNEKDFDLLDKMTAEYGINVAIHDHPKPSHYWDPEILLKAVAGHSKRIGSCSDTGHWFRSGLVPVECLKKLEGRIISLHFKDLDAAKEDVPFGTGLCNARGMLEEIKRQGIHPVFSIEYERTSGQELVDNVTKCRDWFSKTAGELAATK